MPGKKNKTSRTGDEVFTLEITDLNHLGEGVGKADGFALFVPEALPGEIVRASITTIRKNYAEATLLSRVKTSPNRIVPPCPYFYRCGGCQLQHLDYESQLIWKQKMITETLRRIAAVDIPVSPVLGMEKPWHYRNKAQIHLDTSNRQVLAGFFEKKSRHIVDVQDCLVQHPLNAQIINVIRSAVQQCVNMDTGAGTKNLPVTDAAVRTSFATAECLVTFTINKDSIDLLNKLTALIISESKDRLAGVTALKIDNTDRRKHLISLFGETYLKEEIGPYRYKISPQSFFQVNPLQAAVLYRQAAELAGSPGTAFDLYCGTGNFSLYLSRRAKRVIGVDSENSAIADARANAALNNINNVEFVNARAEAVPDLLQHGKRPITIFLNPPRKGSSDELLDAVVKAKPDRIVYISCNPATLARDLGVLQKAGFNARQVQPVDMFPHTSHVESVVLIE